MGRKILCVFLAGVMILGLVACSGTGGRSWPNGGSQKAVKADFQHAIDAVKVFDEEAMSKYFSNGFSMDEMFEDGDQDLIKAMMTALTAELTYEMSDLNVDEEAGKATAIVTMTNKDMKVVLPQVQQAAVDTIVEDMDRYGGMTDAELEMAIMELLADSLPDFVKECDQKVEFRVAISMSYDADEDIWVTDMTDILSDAMTGGFFRYASA